MLLLSSLDNSGALHIELSKFEKAQSVFIILISETYLNSLKQSSLLTCNSVLPGLYPVVTTSLLATSLHLRSHSELARVTPAAAVKAKETEGGSRDDNRPSVGFRRRVGMQGCSPPALSITRGRKGTRGLLHLVWIRWGGEEGTGRKGSLNFFSHLQ